LVVIFDYMSKKTGVFPNLVAYDGRGQHLWTAPNPSNASTDAYVNFISLEPLVVGNFAGYAVTISPRSGDVLGSKFTK